MLLSQTDSVLVVVDMQEKLLPAMSGGDDILRTQSVLLEAARRLDVPCLVTEQYPKGLGDTVVDLQPALAGYPVFEKTTFSCLGAEGFVDALAATERRQVVLVGIETHVCVLQTALELLEQGYAVHVVADAVSSRTGRNRDLGLARMAAAGVVLPCMESVVFEWLRVAGGEDFKVLSKRLR